MLAFHVVESSQDQNAKNVDPKLRNHYFELDRAIKRNRLLVNPCDFM